MYLISVSFFHGPHHDDSLVDEIGHFVKTFQELADWYRTFMNACRKAGWLPEAPKEDRDIYEPSPETLSLEQQLRSVGLDRFVDFRRSGASEAHIQLSVGPPPKCPMSADQVFARLTRYHR